MAICHCYRILKGQRHALYRKTEPNSVSTSMGFFWWPGWTVLKERWEPGSQCSGCFQCVTQRSWKTHACCWKNMFLAGQRQCLAISDGWQRSCLNDFFATQFLPFGARTASLPSVWYCWTYYTISWEKKLRNMKLSCCCFISLFDLPSKSCWFSLHFQFETLSMLMNY